MNGRGLQSVLRVNFDELSLGFAQCEGGHAHPHHHGVSPKEGFAEHLNALTRNETNLLELSGQRQSAALGVHTHHPCHLLGTESV